MKDTKYRDMVKEVVMIRKDLGYTVTQMAELTQSTRQNIYYFENLDRVSYKTLFKYMNILFTPMEMGNFITKWARGD